MRARCSARTPSARCWSTRRARASTSPRSHLRKSGGRQLSSAGRPHARSAHSSARTHFTHAHTHGLTSAYGARRSGGSCVICERPTVVGKIIHHNAAAWLRTPCHFEHVLYISCNPEALRWGRHVSRGGWCMPRVMSHAVAPRVRAVPYAVGTTRTASGRMPQCAAYATGCASAQATCYGVSERHMLHAMRRALPPECRENLRRLGTSHRISRIAVFDMCALVTRCTVQRARANPADPGAIQTRLCVATHPVATH